MLYQCSLLRYLCAFPILLGSILLASCQAEHQPSSDPPPDVSNPTSKPDGASTKSSDAQAKAPLAATNKKLAPARATAEKLLEALLLSKWKSSEAIFAQTLKEALSPSQLESNWVNATAELGTYQSLDDPTPSDFESGIILQYKMNFAKGYLSTKIVVSHDNQIVGLWFFPTVTKSDKKGSQADYAFEAAGLTLHDLEIGLPGWELPASLVIPKKSGTRLPPIVILIPGSGPQDRNATVGPNQPFFHLALELGTRGIGTLRFEKRTLRHRKKSGLLSNFTVEHEFIEDSISAFESLRKRSDINIDAIFFAGHSLGGTVLPRIAEKTPGVAGLIMLAAAARAPHQMIREQIGYLSQYPETGMTAEKRKEIMKEVEQVQQIAQGKKPAAAVRPFGIPQSYWIDFAAYNPARRAKALNLPMLFLQGGRDYQSTMADFDIWQKALKGKKGVMFKAYGNLNHLFHEGSKPSLPAEYMEEKGMPTYLFDDIAAFVKQTVRAGSSQK